MLSSPVQPAWRRWKSSHAGAVDGLLSAIDHHTSARCGPVGVALLPGVLPGVSPAPAPPDAPAVQAASTGSPTAPALIKSTRLLFVCPGCWCCLGAADTGTLLS